MGNKLYVGNLAYSVRDDSLLQAFAQFGTVTSAKVMMDRESGRPAISMASASRACGPVLPVDTPWRIRSRARRVPS